VHEALVEVERLENLVEVERLENLADHLVGKQGVVAKVLGGH
jgi:hypothetical protein